MKKKYILFTFAILTLLQGAVAFGQTTPSEEMEADIRQLMNVTGGGNMAAQVVSQLIGSLKPSMPNVPEAFWQKFMAKVDADELIEMIVPIYAKHFSHEEIKGLLAFYETPLGQKVIATLPGVIQESMMAGQQWGQKIAQQAMAELEAEKE